MAIFGGFLYDILGRRMTMLMCFILCSISALCIPLTAPHIYSWLLLAKIVFTMVITPIFCHPLINDYVHLESRGRAIAISHLGLSLGYLFSSAVLFKYTNDLDPLLSHSTISAWATVSGLILLFLISEP